MNNNEIKNPLNFSYEKNHLRGQTTLRNKYALLEAMEKCLGIVTNACELLNINRMTYYNYYKNDENFKTAIDELFNHQLDFVESKLFEKIKDGSESSIQFYLKYRGSKRGYSNLVQQDITHRGININYIEPKKDDDE